MLHKNVPLGDRHAVHNWEVADLTALAALTVTADDVGKVAKVASPIGMFMLMDATGPAWANIQADPTAVKVTVSYAAPADPSLNDVWIQIPA